MKKSMRLPRFPKITPWMIWVGLLGGMIVAGVVAGYLVFTKGLIVTNLTDRVPWGLWITLDLSSIAISAGAFSLCATVYLLGSQAVPACRPHGYFYRPDRLQHGVAFTDARYWASGPFLAFLVVLEQALPALGSDHVCHALPGSIDHRVHAHLCPV